MEWTNVKRVCFRGPDERQQAALCVRASCVKRTDGRAAGVQSRLSRVQSCRLSNFSQGRVKSCGLSNFSHTGLSRDWGTEVDPQQSKAQHESTVDRFCREDGEERMFAAGGTDGMRQTNSVVV